MTRYPDAIRTVRWMVRDTFRQSVATKLFWAMLGITTLCTVFCFGITVEAPPERPRHPAELPTYLPKGQAGPEVLAEGIHVPDGKVTLGFGLIEYPITKNKADAVRVILIWLAGVVADTAGVLLALLWTAGFLPTFLEPQAVTVLLAKPAPRWAVLAGKYLGVVLFVALQATVFVGATWFAAGAATGVWDGTYWFAVPLLVVNFAVFYSVSALLAVCTRSTVVSVFGTLLFWLLCWSLNFTQHKLAGMDVPGTTPATGTLVKVAYWTLPKPLDMGGIFFDAMKAENFSSPIPELAAAKARGAWYPELAVLTSLVFAAGALALAGYEFRHMDY
ncbi:MAG TPA: ABC transporter permease subunit [Urbifossiella sp.]|nr:ABC transporter permease subunit [Urbifossiella sp.]